MALGTRSAGPGARERRRLYAEAGPAQRRLTRRWTQASVVALHEAPADAISSEARRFRADCIVLGWRGHGSLRRMLAGSVSRAVVSRARIPVLMARTAVDGVRRVVIGFDGSPGGWEAVRFASRLERRAGSRALLVTVLEPIRLPLEAPRSRDLRSKIARLNDDQAALVRRSMLAAAALLERAGWPASIDLRWGVPLDELLEAAEARSQPSTVLIVGARAKRGVNRLLLGSVAEGSLDRARTPVVVVR